MYVRKITLTLLILTSFLIACIRFPDQISEKSTPTFSSQIVKVGATGTDVREMQGRLKFLGFYTGPVDGIFGWRSYWALRNFQYEFGLQIDGVLGPKSKLKLWTATKNWAPSGPTAPAAPAQPSAPATGNSGNLPATNYGISANDMTLMANAVYGESRGESYQGQVAVAAVILNRTRNPAFPNTVSGVIFEPGAFTAVSDGQIWLQPNDTAKKAVQDAINGWDPSNGAIYYFNPDTATSAWIWSRPQVKQIGKHIFCK